MKPLNNNHKHSPFTNDAQKQTLHRNLSFTATEQYKLLRTNLDFVLPAGATCPIIGVTSSMRGDGKSTTAINLSYVLAERGDRVLLIDGDLRIPSIAKKLKLASAPGLTTLLLGKDVDIPALKSELLDNLFILPSGDLPPNPSELLGSGRMEAVLTTLREKFDYIIIDLPPVNIVSDALSISPLITGMLLVIREERTEKKELERCVRQLKLSNVTVLGCVLNESSAGNGPREVKYRKQYRSYYEAPSIKEQHD